MVISLLFVNRLVSNYLCYLKQLELTEFNSYLLILKCLTDDYTSYVSVSNCLAGAGDGAAREVIARARTANNALEKFIRVLNDERDCL